MSIKEIFLKWFNNYPLEAFEYDGEDIKHIKLDKNLDIEEKEIIGKKDLENKNNILINLGIDKIKFYFIDLDSIPKNKEKEKQMIEWKLQNQISNINKEDYIFNYTLLEKTRVLAFIILKEDIKKISKDLNNENLIFNLSPIGIYNYFSKNLNEKENQILISTFREITYIVFLKQSKLESIRFFRTGINEYLEKTDIKGDIVEALRKLSEIDYIPLTADTFFEKDNLDNFEKIKKTNQKWMMGIETELKDQIEKDEYKDYKIVLCGYENALNNIEILLEEYIGIKTEKMEIEMELLVYTSLLGNIYKWYKK